jgi:hypothetical protein
VIVVVEDTTWSDDSVQDLDKVALVAACARGRHVLVNRPSVRPKCLAAWSSTLSRKLQREVQQVLEQGLHAAPGANQSNVVRLTVAPGKDRWREATLTPSTAAELLRRPLKLLLENRRNDLRFLLRMAEPADRSRLEKALRLGWVEPEMGGGLSELKKRLEALREPSSTSERIALARLWVMFDRDASSKDRSCPSEISGATCEICRALDVPWPLAHHQLARRSIESYVPAKTFGAWWPEQVESHHKKQERRRRVEKLLRPEHEGGLRREARHAFNFKNGLRGDLSARVRKAVDDSLHHLSDDEMDPLFRGLHQDVREALALGFRGVAEAFSDTVAIDEEAFRREVDQSERTELLASLFSRL